MNGHISLFVTILVIVWCVPKGNAGDATLPPEVLALQERYQKNIELAQGRYLTELKGLLSRDMMMRDTSEVVAVNHEINRVLASTMAGKWQDTKGIVYINPNGSLLHSNGATGTWTIEEGNMVLIWSNGAKHVFPVVKTGDLLKGTFVIPDGQAPVVLTRLN